MTTDIDEIRKLAAKKFEKVFQKRPYQTRLTTKIVDDWHGNNEHNAKVSSSLIESPPGSGKTVMGFSLAKTFKEECSEFAGYDPDDTCVVWIAGRRNLLAQASKENNELIKCPDVFYLSQFTSSLDGHPLFDYKNHLLVIDEAHHEACSSMHSIINAIDPGYMLGLSATPKRTDNAKLCFQKNYKDAGFYTLIDEGWLSQFEHWMIQDWRPATVVHHYLMDPERWGKSIMFFPNREECDEAMLLLMAQGVKCELVTGQTDRETQIDAFENGDVDVLVNMFVLTEGFDCPLLKTVFVRDSGQLPTVQMCGRVLRPHPDLPTSNIVQSIKTRWPFTRTANIAQSQHVYMDGSWRYIGRSKEVDKAACETIKRLVNIKVDEDMHRKLKAMSKKKRKKT